MRRASPDRDRDDAAGSSDTECADLSPVASGRGEAETHDDNAAAPRAAVSASYENVPQLAPSHPTSPTAAPHQQTTEARAAADASHVADAETHHQYPHRHYEDRRPSAIVIDDRVAVSAAPPPKKEPSAAPPAKEVAPIAPIDTSGAEYTWQPEKQQPPTSSGGGSGNYKGVASPTTGSPDGGDTHIVDKLGHLFLYISIPVSVICCIIAAVLYAMHDVEAVTVSHSIAGLCAFTSFVLTAIQVFMHLSVYTNPTQQRYIVRIILMCPIYAIDSWIGLVAYRYATIVNLVRDSYESYVIYTFFRLLMDYLGGEDATIAAWERTKPDMEHLPPFCCLPHVKLNRRTLNIWKVCLLQYMIVNPLLTLIALPLYFTDNYHDGVFAPDSAYAWFAGIRFISVTFAFTSLVYFFFGSKHLLMSIDPLPKFAAIKTVVFLSFWQTVILAGLNHFGIIPHSRNWTAEEVSTGLGNFVLCIEMYLITIAHRWIFSDKPYHPATGRSRLTWFAVKHAFAVNDVLEDTSQAVALVTPLSSNRAREEPLLREAHAV
jgi:hypothetical protein